MGWIGKDSIMKEIGKYPQTSLKTSSFQFCILSREQMIELKPRSPYIPYQDHRTESWAVWVEKILGSRIQP